MRRLGQEIIKALLIYSIVNLLSGGQFFGMGIDFGIYQMGNIPLGTGLKRRTVTIGGNYRSQTDNIKFVNIPNPVIGSINNFGNTGRNGIFRIGTLPGI